MTTCLIYVALQRLIKNGFGFWGYRILSSITSKNKQEEMKKSN